MAEAATRKILQRRPGETVYGRLIDGAITNGDFDITLEPGSWYVTLFIMANAVSAGNLALFPVAADGTTIAEEVCYNLGFAGTVAVSISLIDQVGPVIVCPLATGAAVGFPIIVFSKLRFTVTAIAGAGATNFIDYVAVRV